VIPDLDPDPMIGSFDPNHDSTVCGFVEFGIFLSNDMAEGAIPLAGNS
jgi:hypothetical protein